jgi:hypothetical protein
MGLKLSSPHQCYNQCMVKIYVMYMTDLTTSQANTIYKPIPKHTTTEHKTLLNDGPCIAKNSLYAIVLLH